MWNPYNANPLHNRVGDCTVRAISTVLNQDWYETFIDLCLISIKMADMPSADVVWGKYLKSKGFRRSILSCDSDLCTTVNDFCKKNPKGTFIVCPKNHVVAVKDGRFFDTWDSGDESINFFWKKENE